MSMILLIIGALGYYSNYYASRGLLQPSDFLLFYFNRAVQINVILLVVGFIIFLYIFIHMFFKGVHVLLSIMNTQEVKKLPIAFKFIPEFVLTKDKIEKMIAKRNESKEHYIEEREHKNELLMYLAHDLKTPLTSLIGYINHILDHNIDEEQQDISLHIANEKAKRLDHLIDEFSEILRYDEKVSQLDLTKIDLHTMIRQQMAGFYPLMEKRQIQADIQIPEDLTMIGDFDKLHRVFDNLMRNAIAYGNGNSTISIRGEHKQRHILLVYQNESEGLEEEVIAHLFDKFYRASTARTSINGGAGLGLAIAKEIVELHHGTIDATTQGTSIVFTIILPCSPEVTL